MTQQFTASEVRDSAVAVAARDMQYEAKMLRAYAERLEADEKAVPVAWLRESGVDIESEGGCITNAVRNLWLASNPKRVERYTIPLFTHPSPAYEERLAEALRAKIRRLRNMPKGEFQLAASIKQREQDAKDAELWRYLVGENNKGVNGAFRIIWFDDREDICTTDGVTCDGRDDEAIVRIVRDAMAKESGNG